MCLVNVMSFTPGSAQTGARSLISDAYLSVCGTDSALVTAAQQLSRPTQVTHIAGESRAAGQHLRRHASSTPAAAQHATADAWQAAWPSCGCAAGCPAVLAPPLPTYAPFRRLAGRRMGLGLPCHFTNKRRAVESAQCLSGEATGRPTNRLQCWNRVVGRRYRHS